MGRPIRACGLLAVLGAAACGGSNGATGGVTVGDGGLVFTAIPTPGGNTT